MAQARHGRVRGLRDEEDLAMKYIYAALVWLWTSMAAAAQQNTIVFLVDVSASIDQREMDLQMNGYRDALAFFPYLDNFLVEVIVFSDLAHLVVSGTVDDARAYFADPHIPSAVGQLHNTCLGSAMQFVSDRVAQYPGNVILDISGDDPDNCAGSDSVRAARDALTAQGVMINALAIVSEPTEPNYSTDHAMTVIGYYRDNVVNGRVFVAETFFDVENTLYEKLSFEVSQLR